MKYYITKEGDIQCFTNSPSISFVYKASRSFLHKQIENNINKNILELTTCDKIFFLHPSQQLTTDSVINTVFDSFVPNTMSELLSLIEKTSCYIIISKITHESYNTFIDVFTMGEEEYNKYMRIHKINTFLDEN